MHLKEYFTHVNLNLPKDYGKWIKFSEFFPVPPEVPYEGVLIEVLFEGNPSFHSLFVTEDMEVRFRDYDFNQELLEWQTVEAMSAYWRYLPPPPEDASYDCG